MTALEAQLVQKRRDLRWRGPVEYTVRYTLAWLFNIAVLLVACFVSIIYALKFHDKATKKMAISWLIAYGVTFAIVEPLQVLIITCAPCIFDEDRKCGRLMVRCRFAYNELCAP